MAYRPRYFDIAVNLTDRMFHGDYNDKNYHPTDIETVLNRAKLFNVNKMLVTGSSLAESELALNIASDPKHKHFLYSTVGVHPCTVGEIAAAADENEYLHRLKQLTISGKESGVVKAFGEIGLDYDRLHYTPADIQKKYFEKQLLIACEVDLPLFLHMRAACDDFIEIIAPFINGTRSDGIKFTENNKKGVVHSFTGDSQELQKLLALGFYIGVNGCSLKMEENLEVVKAIPLNRLLIETDSPWCEIRASSAAYGMISKYPSTYYPEISQATEDITSTTVVPPSKKNGPVYKFDNFLPIMSVKKDQYNKYLDTVIKDQEIQEIGRLAKPLIKSRNEPCFIGYVAEVVAKLHGLEATEVIETCYKNSCKLFDVL